jgi:protein ImuA
MNSARRELLQNLTQRIREIEAGTAAHRSSVGQALLPAGQTGVSAPLPEALLSAGTLTELISAADGAGAMTLALIAARRACGECQALVVVDGQRSFYPPAAARLGVDLQHTLVVRPRTQQDLWGALELALRSTAVGAVLGWCDRLPALACRRLQLAAETGGAVGLLLRPHAALRTPSFAALRLSVVPLPSADGSRRLQVEVLHRRGGKSGQVVMLEIDDETGHVHLPAELAAATALARAARASG